MAGMNLRRRRGPSGWVVAICALGALAAAAVLWQQRDRFRPPQALYGEAQQAGPARAGALYARLGEKLPALDEYARLWAAEAQMPDVDAMRTLQALADLEPQGALALEAHVALARYYAGIEATEAADEYRAALALDDNPALRLELARFLEQQGDAAGAYAEYRTLLSKQPDAFAGMRRTGADPLAVAQDLISATFYSDALEELQGVDDPKALPLLAAALAALEQYNNARAAYEAWLQANPDDQAAQMGLARMLEHLDRAKDALAIYRKINTPDSRLAQADLLRDSDAKQALALNLDSPYPVAWWNATRMLESQHRLTETLPIYERIARTDTAFADDAAYRLTVLGKRLGDSEAQALGRALLDGFGLDWLAIRANDDRFTLPVAPPIDAAGSAAGAELLARVRALESIGREDEARLELVLASRARRAPEVDLAMAQGLAERGEVRDAQAIAEKSIADRGRAPLEFWKLSYPRPYSDTVQSVAAEFKLDPLLLWAMMREESRFDPEAVSYVGARGLLQLMPSTQTWIAEQMGQEVAPGDAFQPAPNIRMGAWYLRYLLDHFQGDTELALMAYNGGAASVEAWQRDPLVADRDDLLRWIGYGETREYVQRVSLSYRIYRELYGG
jgi:soluble lytic murein transglycosylase